MASYDVSPVFHIELSVCKASGVTEKEGALVIFDVEAPVACCHCLTEILYLY